MDFELDWLTFFLNRQDFGSDDKYRTRQIVSLIERYQGKINVLVRDLDDVDIDYFMQMRDELDTQITQYQDSLRQQENQSNKMIGGNARAKQMLTGGK